MRTILKMYEYKIEVPASGKLIMETNKHNKNVPTIRYVDLFCGIGGFRYALEGAAKEEQMMVDCVFSSDIDLCCKKAYEANFGERPEGDIKEIEADSIPDHQLLLAGFPCQPFSIIGNLRGFEDTRGTLFFDIARILEAKRPDVFVLENVKLLAGHNKGITLARIIQALKDLKYFVSYKVLNAIDFGLPQKRERIFIVGYQKPSSFHWPSTKVPMKPLSSILEQSVPRSYYASDYIRNSRKKKLRTPQEITIWHENKAGHLSAYPYSCALRAGASYNYLLVNGERRLTEREMLRLQGFPDSFKIVCNYSQTRKQAGNSLPVPVAKAVIKSLLRAYQESFSSAAAYTSMSVDDQIFLLEKGRKYGKKTKTSNSGKIRSALSVE